MKKELNYTLNQKYWFCCDFETIHEDTDYFKRTGDTRVILFHTKNWDNTINLNGVSIFQWWDYFWNLGESCTIFFHNLKFDGDFIAKFLVNEKGFKINNSKSKLNKSFQIFRNGGRIYYIKIFFRKRINNKVKDINLFIRCSFMLLNSSIKALGKSLGIAKLTEEQQKDKTFYVVEPVDKLEELDPDFISYCERDTEIMRLSLLAFEKSIESLSEIQKYNTKKKRKKFNVFNSLTISALSRRLMKYYSNSYFYENKGGGIKPLLISKDAYNALEMFYRGGWTQINPNYLSNPQEIGEGIMVDVVSAYPFQMTQNLPYGEVLEEPPEEGPYYEFYVVEVKKAKIKKGFEHCPILKMWNKDIGVFNRYATELNNFTCYYLKEEWELINLWYDIEIKKRWSIYMKAAPFLKAYASEVIDKKQHFKKAGKDAFSMGMKILANAGYGGLAMREKYDNYVYLEQEQLNKLLGTVTEFIDYANKQDIHFELDDKQFKFKRISSPYQIGNYHLTVLEDQKDKLKLPNKAAAAVITALERVYLWNFIYDVGVRHFGMSDTDSILFINVDQKAKDKISKRIGHNLGNWEIENKTPIKYFGTFGAKKYILLDQDKQPVKLKMSGISLESLDLKENFSQKFNMDDDTITLENAVLTIKYCKSGIVLVKKDKIFKKGTI